ncbi:MAG: hypothetical protein K2X64_01880 [Rhodocyclaceae bacterium]|nr:hypothetical protein [Rhodocyclaceae bacterium]
MSDAPKSQETQLVTAKPPKSKSNAEHWADVFLSEFAKESDRAAVIVAASIFDNSLRDLLKQYLVPNASGTDELFDGTNAPLATFSAKIAFAHRLGLISGSFARNLHLIRRIRNEFAHNIHGGSFEDTAVKSRVMELYKSQVYKNETTGSILHPKGARGDFLTVCVWMVWVLTSMVEKTVPIKEAALEFGFTQPKKKRSK